MISYWVSRDGKFGIDAYRENRGAAIAGRFDVREYEDIGTMVRFQQGPQIFSALDRLGDAGRAVVGAIWDAHEREAPDAPRLNDPRRVLLRFPLLTALHAQGVNGYRVYDAADAASVARFPVFLRHRHEHTGPRTPLLHTRAEIVRALVALRMRGYRVRDLMIVEFCDTSDRDKMYRKYSAFKVADRIMPSHLMISSQWCVKSAHHAPTEDSVREGLEYIEGHPHREWLAQVFAIAGVDYGRVDYGVLDGRPQVWEINLNPTVGRASGWQARKVLEPGIKTMLEAGRRLFHDRLRDAFVALDAGHGTGRQSTLAVDPEIHEALQRELARATNRQRWLDAISGIYHHPQWGRPARTIGRLFPTSGRGTSR